MLKTITKQLEIMYCQAASEDEVCEYLNTCDLSMELYKPAVDFFFSLKKIKSIRQFGDKNILTEDGQYWILLKNKDIWLAAEVTTMVAYNNVAVFIDGNVYHSEDIEKYGVKVKSAICPYNVPVIIQKSKFQNRK